MMLPDELEWVLEMLGYKWPTANEDKLRDCAAVWREFGEKVNELHTTANGAARQVTAHNAGESIDKFTKTYEKFDGGGGNDGYLRNAAEAAFLIANVLEACAYLVEFAKWAVIAQLIALAIQIAAAAAAAPFTFGLSSVAGMGATQAARLIVRRLLDELKQALIEAIIETMKEPAISAIEAIITDLIRQTVNVGFGAQEGYDVGATLKAGGEAGLDALRQSPQTFAEGLRDSLGQKAGSRARHAVDSRIDGYDGASGSDLPGGDIGSDSSSGSESSSSSSSSDSSSSDSSSSDSSSSDSDSNTSTRSSNGNIPGANIGSGISADTGGNDIPAPNIGAGPDSGPGPGSDSGNPSSSDSPYARPTQTPGSSLSDFDDPSPSGPSANGSDSNGSSSTPSTSGPSHSGGGSPVSGLSSPSPQSTPTASSSGGTSSSPGGGSIGTQIDGLAASAPTQSNAAPTPTADSSPAGSGGRSDGGGSGMPTSPTAPSTGGAAPGGHHGPGASGGGPSSATSPNPGSGPARNPSASTAGTPSTTGTGPASTPSPTSPATPRSTPASTPGTTASATGSGPASTPSSTAPSTTPRATPSQTPDPRTPGSDGRTPGTADSRVPNQSNPTQNSPGTTPGDRTPPRNAPGTTPGDRTPSRDNPGTTPGDRTPNRDNTSTPPGDRTPPRNTADSTGTRTPGQNPGPTTHSPASQNPNQTTPNQNPAQSSPSRTPSPTAGTPTTSPAGSSNNGSDRASTPGSNNQSPSTQPGRAHTPGTPNQPSADPGTTPPRPHQPAGNTPNTPPNPNPNPNPNPKPNAPQQPAAQSPQAENTRPDRDDRDDRDRKQQQVTAVPIHTVVTTPGVSPSPSHADPTPQNPGSPQATPGNQSQPQQDSLDDIRSDLDHQPGGLSQPDPADQQALADAVPHNEDGTPQRFPDPFGPYTQLQNDGGNTVPGRSNNCADCSRSFLETWYGNPQVSAPRTVDLDENGKHNPFTPEDNANANQIRWTGAAHTYAGPGGDPNTANNIASTLQQAGPGSAAIVQVDWPGGGGHAFNVVNHNGKIVWIDTQSGEVSDKPLHIDQAKHVWHIPLDADRNPIDTSTSDDKDTEDSKDSKDSDSQNDEAQNQNDDASQPENSENDGQSETNQNAQSDASDNTPAQGDNPDTATDPAKSATPPPPDSSNSADATQPSTADPSTSKPEGTPDGRERSPETAATPEQQSRPDEATRPDSASEHRQSPTDTASDNGTPDKSTPLPRTETDSPNNPTTDRGTSQQNTTPADPRTSVPHQQNADPRAADPRTADSRTTDPRITDPRTMDPRTSDPRASDPRTSDPHRDNPTQRRPEADGRPDGQRPETSPRPDQTRPGHDDPRSGTPDKDRSETPDQTRSDDGAEAPANDHRDRPSGMTRDSTVPTRESLPDGRNADASRHINDATAGKKPLYGEVAPESPAHTAKPATPQRPEGPAQPTGDPINDPRTDEEWIDHMVHLANTDPDFFDKHYRTDSNGRPYRHSSKTKYKGHFLPILRATGDPQQPWMAASRVPQAEDPTYVDPDVPPVGRTHGSPSQETLDRLDERAASRADAIEADRAPHAKREAAQKALKANDTPENRAAFKEADDEHRPFHAARGKESERYGDEVAEFHAIPNEFEGAVRIDNRAEGNNRFDQIWDAPPNETEFDYVVVECKGSLRAPEGDRQGLPPDANDPDRPAPGEDDQHGQDTTGEENQEADGDAVGPAIKQVSQGTREYFKAILHEMDKRGLKGLDDADAESDPVKAAELRKAAQDELDLAENLRTALKEGRVKYMLVKGNSNPDTKTHEGYQMKEYDIRLPEKDENAPDSTS
ncbi:toxin glutamine deamidase domain-containing protein [Streptomyces sp. AC550_RSS872]|uniref:toxin glutamine deamidase domain-containing protein n=1 Tax=Streptomyces sp. AC550_RSS872 TaxID=2823689 RepID=UPI001C26E29A|nr:toxin glutamine deamidase domain-containing protein [Streptomyces sp. AC550_RSS872]